MDQRSVTFYRWEEMPKERVSDMLQLVVKIMDIQVMTLSVQLDRSV